MKTLYFFDNTFTLTKKVTLNKEFVSLHPYNYNSFYAVKTRLIMLAYFFPELLEGLSIDFLLSDDFSAVYANELNYIVNSRYIDGTVVKVNLEEYGFKFI